MAKKNDKGEPVGWVTVKGKHFPKWADGTIGWQNGEESLPSKLGNKSEFGKQMEDEINNYQSKFLTKRSDEEIAELKKNLETSGKIAGTTKGDQVALAAIEREQKSRAGKKKSPWTEVNDYRDRLSKAKTQKEKDKVMDEMDEAWKRYDHDKSLSDVEKNQLQSHLHDTWTGKYKKTARDTANEVLRIRDSLDNGGKAVTSNKEVADMYKQNANSNFDFKVQGKNGEYHITATKKATMELGNGLRLTADVSNPNKNISEVERARKVNREKQYADKKLNQYRKAAQEEKEKAQSIADAISAKTGVPNTTSRNAKYDTSRSSKKVSAREAKAVANLMGTKKRRDGEVVPHYLSEYSDEAMIQHLNKVQPKQGYEWKIDHIIDDTIYGKHESRYFKRVSKKK